MPAVVEPLPKPLQHAGENWTPAEIGSLCIMDSQGDTVKAMAAQLGRSELAVKMKLDALGLPQRRVPPPPAPAAAAALPAPALHAGSKRKQEDREANGQQEAGAPAPSTPAKKR
ncbi:hypothetical protein HYH02_011935 [Chlamydomonas schloesseri]|uniref:Uncharacterized protein n=1 Tax=Chlamydomonas schloesseri TaxID=2026947 RepID=A0A835TAQ0_9CHLO|nr:hypothetical protein HYH02_011935 [Chlamydomonas schloesseri]|eukprot:KAG2435435.1 hypothetical protein HYH02_011935 [Chlamydomonas schloesseri]